MFFVLVTPSVIQAQEFRVPEESANSLDILLPESFGIRLEEILGDKPKWEPITSLSKSGLVRTLGKSVGRLRIIKRGIPYVCTAFLVDYDKILTNYHCLSGKTGRAQRIRLDMGYVTFGDASGVETFNVETRPILKNANLDFALLRVKGRPGEKYGVLSLSNKNVQPTGATFIVHHPAGKPKKVTRDGCRVLVSARGSTTRWSHSCDTVGGSSGSPVFDNTGSVVALHFAAGNSHDGSKINFAKPIGKIRRLIDGELPKAKETLKVTSGESVEGTNKMIYFRPHKDIPVKFSKFYSHTNADKPLKFDGWVLLGVADTNGRTWLKRTVDFPALSHSGYSYGLPDHLRATSPLKIVERLPFLLPEAHQRRGGVLSAYRLNNVDEVDRTVNLGGKLDISQVIFRRISPEASELWARVRKIR